MIENIRDCSITILPPQKVCRCGGTRFGRCAQKRDGLQSVCLDCMAAHARRYYRRRALEQKRLRKIERRRAREAAIDRMVRAWQQLQP